MQETVFNGPSRASISRSDTKGWIKVTSPYKKKFVEDLKSTIEPACRKWDPNNKVWEINGMYLEELVVLLKMHYDEIVQDLTTEESTVPDNIFVPIFEVLKGKPESEKVYKTLAFSLHPDRGGNSELMTKLNSAYQAVNK